MAIINTFKEHKEDVNKIHNEDLDNTNLNEIRQERKKMGFNKDKEFLGKKNNQITGVK